MAQIIESDIGYDEEDLKKRLIEQDFKGIFIKYELIIQRNIPTFQYINEVKPLKYFIRGILQDGDDKIDTSTIVRANLGDNQGDGWVLTKSGSLYKLLND